MNNATTSRLRLLPLLTAIVLLLLQSPSSVTGIYGIVVATAQATTSTDNNDDSMRPSVTQQQQPNQDSVSQPQQQQQPLEELSKDNDKDSDPSTIIIQRLQQQQRQRISTTTGSTGTSSTIGVIHQLREMNPSSIIEFKGTPASADADVDNNIESSSSDNSNGFVKKKAHEVLSMVEDRYEAVKNLKQRRGVFEKLSSGKNVVVDDLDDISDENKELKSLVAMGEYAHMLLQKHGYIINGGKLVNMRSPHHAASTTANKRRVVTFILTSNTRMD